MGPETLQEALDVVKATRGQTFVARLRAMGMDPLTDLAGGDWSGCRNWGDEDATNWDFRNANLNDADLSTLQNLDKARFGGLGGTEMEGTILPEGMTVEMLSFE